MSSLRAADWLLGAVAAVWLLPGSAGAGDEVRPLVLRHDAVVRAVAFGDADRVVLTQTAETLRRWDMATGKRLATKRMPLPRSDDRLQARTADGRLFLEATEMVGGIYTLQGTRQNPFRIEFSWTFQPDEELRSLAVSPDGKLLALGHAGGLVQVWEMASWQPVYLLRGHEKDVTCLAFSRRGRWLVSGSADATALIWDLTIRAPLNAPWGSIAPEQVWALLGDGRAALAFQAFPYLHAHPQKGIDTLKSHLPAVIDRRRLPPLLHDLDADSYAVRTKAFDELTRLDRDAARFLRKALEENQSPEVRARLRQLLGRPSRAFEVRAWSRAVIFLEREGSAAAKELLKTLARRHPSPGVAADAQAALDRMKPLAPNPTRK